ncbi:MAG: hypothetical protein A2539_04505 [Elusimicrobia bacterium RIFOXYD2_FULL_34_15]|nr:MAG: hypothetical protein A2539_04505 [Elusimicrobia bacterium RIFOXYD2_FULL_34_15]
MLDLQNIAIVISEKDNVAVAKTNIKKGVIVKYVSDTFKILNNISKGFRFSIKDIKKNELVKQYGYPFGISKGIKKGQLISADNVKEYFVNYNKVIKPSQINKYQHKKNILNKTFKGYVRSNGQVGTRNYYLIVPTSMCASDVTSKIANSLDNDKLLKSKYKNIDGFVAAAHTEGCGCNDGDIINRLMLTLKNTIIHPNVGGALIVDLGCEKTNKSVISKYLGNLNKYKKPIDFITIQDLGGTGKAITSGQNIILSRLSKVNNFYRQEVALKHLKIGTECGASDSFSGITANPLIGNTVDKIIDLGGSAILSEIPEMIGAEANLIQRMLNNQTVKKFKNGINYYKNLARTLNVSMDGNLVDANKKGGLITVTLKSLGAILKGGSSEVVDFLDYAELIKKHGLNIMNGPGNDLESMTGIVASGANLILFSTGLGATEGSLTAPVIRITSTTELYNKIPDDMDFNAGRLLDDNNTSLDKLSNELLDLVIAIASGQRSCSEVWKKRSFQIWTAGKLSL